MSSNIRSFLRSNRTHNKIIKTKVKQETRSIGKNHHHHLLLRDINNCITNINYQQNSLNSSCCGGDEKKNAMKETITDTKAIADPMEASDHKIEHVTQQHANKIDIDNDLFDKKDLTNIMINQLTQRALTGSMNSNNDNPPRLCTKKHCSFANEPLTIKPVTCVPGIGPVHGNLCEKQGIIMAHQLLSRYMMSVNDEEFEKSLVDQLGFTPKSAAMTRDGLKEMRRHLI